MKTKAIKDGIKRFLKNKKSLFITIPVAIFTLYTAFGFWGVPLIAEKIVPYFLKKKEIFLKIDDLKFNPFTYECNVTGVDLETFAPLFQAKQIDTKLNIKELFKRSISIDVLRFTAPSVNILKEHNATFNFEPFTSKNTQPSDDNKTAFFNVILDHIQIIDGSLAYDDRSLVDPFDIKFNDIDYEIQGVNLLEKTIGRHTFGANSNTIKNITWNGGIDINPLQIYGRLDISDLKISPFWISFLEKQNLKVEQGTINSTVNYNVVVGNHISVLLQDSNLTLSNLMASEGNKTLLIGKLDIPRLNFDAKLAKEKNATLSIDEITTSGLDYNSEVQIKEFKIANTDAKFDMDKNGTLTLNLDLIKLENGNFRDKNIKYALRNLAINHIKTNGEMDGNFTKFKTNLDSIKLDDFFFQRATKEKFSGGFDSFLIKTPSLEYTLLQNDKNLKILAPDNTILNADLDMNLTKFGLESSNLKDFSLKMAINDDAILLKSGGDVVEFDKFIMHDSNKTATNLNLNKLKISSPSFELNSIDNKQSGSLKFAEILANKFGYLAIAKLENLAILGADFAFNNEVLQQNFTLNGGLSEIKLDKLNFDNNRSQNADISSLIITSPSLNLTKSSKNLNLISNVKSLDINQSNLSFAPNIRSLNAQNSSFSNININLNQDANNSNIGANLQNIGIFDIALDSKNAKLDLKEIAFLKPKIEVKNGDFNATLQNIKFGSPKASFDKFSLALDSILLSNLTTSSLNGDILSSLSDLNTTKISILYSGKNFINSSNLALKNSSFESGKNGLFAYTSGINLGKTDIFSGEKIFAGVGGASLKELRFDTNKNDLKIENILINAPKFESVVNENGVKVINSLEFLKQKSEAKSTSSINPLKFSVKNAKLSNGEVKISENFSSQYLNHTVNAINLEAQNISSLGTGFNFKGSAKSSDSVSFSSSGLVKLEPFRLDANLDIEAANLSKFNPFMQQFLDAKITDGKVAYKGKIAFNNNLSLHGKVSLVNLNIKDEQDVDFFAIKLLDLNTLSFKNSALNIDKIDIKSPFIKVAIAQDKSFNISKIIKKTDEKKDKNTKKSDFKFTLSNINLEDGNMDFSDHSLFLPFNISVHKLKTTIDMIKKDIPANIKLSGVVGERGLSQITINTMPFAPKNKTDFTMIYKDIELKNITPYSAKFVGYEIKNGRANLNLHYTINDSKLSAKNDINLDSLQLGHKVQSTDAMDLPLELAISVLKDSKDQINISLPVSGNLNDPKFSYGGIIIGAVTKLFADVVMSPFRLIGNILGIDADKLNGVDFTAGSDEILDSEIPKLEDLKKIALAKPEIRLTITPAYSKKIDTYSYQKSYLDNDIALLMNKDGLSYNDVIESLKTKYAPGFKGSQDALIKELASAKKFTESKLDDLAVDRAEAIKDKLEDMGVDSAQIAIKNVKNVPAKQDTFITLEIGVENR